MKTHRVTTSCLTGLQYRFLHKERTSKVLRKRERECFRLLGKLERMLPIIGKIGENASENWKPQIVNDPDPDSDLD